LSDAKGSVQRGLEVVEFACGIPHLMKGEYSDNITSGMDLYSIRQPLACARDHALQFPGDGAMWMFPMAIACGNTFILSPRKRSLLPAAPGRADARGGRASECSTWSRRQGGLRMKVLPQAIAMGNIHIGTIAGKLKA